MKYKEKDVLRMAEALGSFHSYSLGWELVFENGKQRYQRRFYCQHCNRGSYDHTNVKHKKGCIILIAKEILENE